MSLSVTSIPSATSNTLRVPKVVRRRPVLTPEMRRVEAFAKRDRSLELSLYEFVLRIRAAEGERIAVGTVQNLSSRITKIFHTKEIVRFRKDHISLDKEMIQDLTEEFEGLEEECEDFEEFAPPSETVAFQDLKEKGFDLHSLSQSIETCIHNPPEFFDRKMSELSELASMREEEKLRRKHQRMDFGYEPLNITLTPPSGETKVLVPSGGPT